MSRVGRVAHRLVRSAVSVGVALLVAITVRVPASSAQSTSGERVARLQSAAAIEGATRARLGVLGDAFTCPDARFASFRRSDTEPQIADQWYVASQLWADARLLAVAAPATADGQRLVPDWDPRTPAATSIKASSSWIGCGTMATRVTSRAPTRPARQ